MPDCGSCHAQGKAAPNLIGQKAEYVAVRLRHRQQETGVVDARQSPATMAMIARRIPEDRIDALAAIMEKSQESSP